MTHHCYTPTTSVGQLGFSLMPDAATKTATTTAHLWTLLSTLPAPGWALPLCTDQLWRSM